MRLKKIQKHVPCANEALLINAGEKSGKVLVAQLEMAMFWSLSKDGKDVIYHRLQNGQGRQPE